MAPLTTEFDSTTHHQHLLDTVINVEKIEDLPDYVLEQMAAMSSTRNFKIAVLYTGGTIGMALDENGKLIPINDANHLMKPLEMKGLGKKISSVWYRVNDPAIDSTNGRWPYRVTLGNTIKLLYDKFDGFVVVSGTDTMAHMVAALQFMFPNAGKPIIATGAQKPEFYLGSDAMENLYFALEAACGDISGAHLAFGRRLIHGLHVRKVKDEDYEAFEGPDDRYIGKFNGKVSLFANAPKRMPYVNQANLIFNPHFREGVAICTLNPGEASMSLRYAAKAPTTDVLIVITYGAGNTRDVSPYPEEPTHVDIIGALSAEEFPVVLGSSMPDGKVDSPYASGGKSISMGGISANNTTGATLQVKVMYVLALSWDDKKKKVDYEKFRNLMQQNIVGELT